MAAPPPPPPAGKPLGPPVVELFNVAKAYRLEGPDGGGGEGVTAVRGVDLAVRRGEFVMIRGPSGGGKTTLLNCMGLIDTPTRGTMRLFGDLIDFASASDAALSDLRLRRIGIVFQAFNLLSTLSAYENVELPMTLLGGAPPRERAARTQRLLELVGLEDRMHHLPSELSGGEQQRVAIARALANNPGLLLLDEPTGDLDTANTVRVMDLLLRLNVERGVTVCMVTHDPNLECYADRVLYVADGAVVGQAVNVAQSRLDLPSYVRFLQNEEAT